MLGTALAGCGKGAVDDTTDNRPHARAHTDAALAVAPFFQDRTSDLGLQPTAHRSQPDSFFMPDIMGAGVALLDYDLDGDVDLAFAGSAGNTAANKPRNPGIVLYRQNRDGRFEDVTSDIETPDLPQGTVPAGLAVGDVNNDGRPDLYLSAYGTDQLFLNDVDGGFRNVTGLAGVANLNWGTSACFWDYDRDGWLDLFVTNYVDYFPQKCVQLSGASEDYCSPARFSGTADRLFRNVTGDSPEGSVRFVDVTFQSGIGNVSGKGLGVVAADLTGDDWPDLYVANDQEANFLWVNQQDDRFTEEALIRGCALDALGNAQARSRVLTQSPEFKPKTRDKSLLPAFVSRPGPSVIAPRRHTLTSGRRLGRRGRCGAGG